MFDPLLKLSSNPLAKKVVRRLGLPLPLPEPLARVSGPWRHDELSGRVIALSPPAGPLGVELRRVLTEAGAALDEGGDGALHGFCHDGTGHTTVESLAELMHAARDATRRLSRCGKVVILGAPAHAAETAESAAVAATLRGFVKSLAKELGKRGGTAQLIEVPAAARTAVHLATPLIFFLSARSAFISGQVLPLSSVTAPASLPLTLKGKKALVTGSARGIGAAIAARLSADGAVVVGIDRQEAHYTCDLGDRIAIAALVKNLRAEHDGFDVVIHNAGITRDKTLRGMKDEYWDVSMAVNLRAVIDLTAGLLADRPHIKEGGRIVCMSSIGGIAGNVGQTNYAAAKAGVIGYVEALAPQLAARNVTVNALAPGFIDTAMTRAMPLAVREVARRFNALSQAGHPEDVAEAAAFLASPGAFAVTGTTLRVCGLNLIGA
jgi:3-oxoacyl-[acyl-carrier protein] reductase